MSLSTYADLQTQVANWLARSDLNSFIPDMITVFEAAACRRLKVRQMETAASIVTSGGVGSLPSDYLGYRRVTWQGSPLVDLTYVAPSMFQLDNPVADQGPPLEFTIEASSIKITPQDDTGLELLYYARTPAVRDALNWLYTNHPDAYLFGTLAEANMFMKGSALPLAASWKQRRDEVFDEIQRVEFWERGGMSVRVFGNTP